MKGKEKKIETKGKEQGGRKIPFLLRFPAVRPAPRCGAPGEHPAGSPPAGSRAGGFFSPPPPKGQLCPAPVWEIPARPEVPGAEVAAAACEELGRRKRRARPRSAGVPEPSSPLWEPFGSGFSPSSSSLRHARGKEAGNQPGERCPSVPGSCSRRPQEAKKGEEREMQADFHSSGRQGKGHLLGRRPKHQGRRGRGHISRARRPKPG